MAGTAIEPDGKCRWCGSYHGVQCPAVRAIEFYPEGSVKRVEYKTGADYPQIIGQIGPNTSTNI